MQPLLEEDPVQWWAHTTPTAPAVISPDGVWTYAQWDALVAGAARWLGDQGLRRGDRVALRLPTSTSYLALLLACFRCGIIAVPLSSRVPPAALPPLLQGLAVRAFITEESWDAEAVPCLPPGPWHPVKSTHVDSLDLDQPCSLVQTSGSTGTPKAALLTWGNHAYSAAGSATNLPLQPGDRWLLTLPLYHVGGLSIPIRCARAGAAVVLPAPEAPLGTQLDRLAVTHTSLVATQALRVLQSGVSDPPPALRALLLGGSALPASLLDTLFAQGWPVHTSYGLTEMASQVTTTPPHAPRSVLDTAGSPLPHRDVRLAHDGELLVRGAVRFAGYLSGDVLTQPFDADGWFSTGDLGSWTPEGYLKIRGRKDFLVISGGENIQPEEVEAALLRLPGVRRAVVVPVPDAEYGQRPVAFMDATPFMPDRWREALTDTVARFKHPDAFFPWPADALDDWKVDRRFFQQRALALRS